MEERMELRRERVDAVEGGKGVILYFEGREYG
jgi:hypothetical protein